MAAKKRKPAKKKVSPCTSCKSFKVTPARNKDGQFTRRSKTGKANR